MTNNKTRNNDMVSEGFFAFALKGIRTSTRVPKARLVWTGHSEFDLKMVASTLLCLAAIHLKRRPDKMAGAIDAFNCCADSLKISRDIKDVRAEASALHGFAVCSIQMALLDPSLC